MKKKVLAVALTVILLATVVGGTLAWFTDTDEVKNTFTIGSIKVEQVETGRNEEGQPVPFKQEQPLFPIANAANPKEDKGYVVKEVTVQNKGKNEAYVRTFIAIPTKLADYITVDMNTESANWKQDTSMTRTVTVQDNFLQDKPATEYTVYTYVYQKQLEAAGDENGLHITDILMEGVYMNADVDIQDNPATESTNLELCRRNADGTLTFSGVEMADKDGNALKDDNAFDIATIDILVATQAVQAQGFTDAETALDSAFGDTMPDFDAVF